MKTTRHTRIADRLTLYASVLFSLVLCGLHHGQMGGLRLAGLEGGFCSINSEHGVAIDLEGAGGDQHMAQLDCPVCSSFGLAVPLSSSGWSFTRRKPWPPRPSWCAAGRNRRRVISAPPSTPAPPATFPAAVPHFA